MIGFGLIKYSFPITNFFGHIPWAERYLGGGGTYTLYKIVGVIVIILAFLYMFGSLGSAIAPLGKIFGGQ